MSGCCSSCLVELEVVFVAEESLRYRQSTTLREVTSVGIVKKFSSVDVEVKLGGGPDQLGGDWTPREIKLLAG